MQPDTTKATLAARGWQPQKCVVESGLLDNVQSHPSEIYESPNMEATPLPHLSPLEPSQHVRRAARAGALSSLQLETAAYAAQSLKTQGAFFLGDATGVGKTRTCLCLLYTSPSPRDS